MDNNRDYRIEILPYAFPENNGKVCEVGIEKMSITYIQQDDTNHGGRDDVQTITIETEDAICTREEALNKQGYYLVIKTDRWAVDEPEDLTMLVNDFKDRLYCNLQKLKANEYADEMEQKYRDKMTITDGPQYNSGVLSPDNPQDFKAEGRPLHEGYVQPDPVLC